MEDSEGLEWDLWGWGGTVGLGWESKGHPGSGTQLHGSVLSSFPGLHMLQVVSSCDLLSNGVSMDLTGMATRAGISSSFQLGPGSFAGSDGATWISQRCWESKGIMVEQTKHYLGHTWVEIHQMGLGGSGAQR